MKDACSHFFVLQPFHDIGNVDWPNQKRKNQKGVSERKTETAGFVYHPLQPLNELLSGKEDRNKRQDTFFLIGGMP